MLLELLLQRLYTTEELACSSILSIWLVRGEREREREMIEGGETTYGFLRVAVLHGRDDHLADCACCGDRGADASYHGPHFGRHCSIVFVLFVPERADTRGAESGMQMRNGYNGLSLVAGEPRVLCFRLGLCRKVAASGPIG